MKVSEKLKRAKNVIETYGWVKGRFGNAECGYCVFGAITVGVSPDDIDGRYEALEFMQSYLTAKGGGEVTSVPKYNDTKIESKDQAIALLDEAIGIAEARGQ